jgi:hypothetical protein
MHGCRGSPDPAGDFRRCSKWFAFLSIPGGLPRELANKSMLYELWFCRQFDVPCPNALVPTWLADVNEFAQAARFPLVLKAAAPCWIRS